MSVFNYIAKTDTGEAVNGRIEAIDHKAAIAKLTDMGYFPIKITSSKSKDKSKWKYRFTRKKITEGDLATFYRQLSDLLEGGLTISHGLDVLKLQYEGKPIHGIINSLTGNINKGSSLSQAMNEHPDVFSSLDNNMVNAGETAGDLETSLTYLSTLKERNSDLKSKVKSALVYPSFLILVSILTIIALMALVIPNLTLLYDDLGQNYPFPLLIFSLIRNFVINYGWILIGIVVLIIVVFNPYRIFRNIRRAWDNICLRIPVISKIIVKSEISNFSRTLGSLLKNGLPILNALTLSINAIQNKTLRFSFENINELVAKGRKLGHSLRSNPYLPLTYTEMISVGEESNKLEATLNKLADSYQNEIDRLIRLLTTLIEPAIILIIAIIVGSIIISVMYSIFNMDLGGL